MNKLVNFLLSNKNFPVLFTFQDFNNKGYTIDEYNICLKEGILNGYIDNVYGNIYALLPKYREKWISQGILAQIIEPNSYISLYYVLCEYSWIPEFVFSVTSVTTINSYVAEAGEYGTFIYKKIYDNISDKGIEWEKRVDGDYRIAKPLRALCDLMYMKNASWKSIETLYEVLRIDKNILEEELTAKDFDELQDSFGIKSIETFLESIRKELRL
jgi:hypothetical protein